VGNHYYFAKTESAENLGRGVVGSDEPMTEDTPQKTKWGSLTTKQQQQEEKEGRGKVRKNCLSSGTHGGEQIKEKGMRLWIYGQINGFDPRISVGGKPVVGGEEK